jgi:hypothetical protein
MDEYRIDYSDVDSYRHLTTLAMLKRLPELAPRPTTSHGLRHIRRHHSLSSPLYAPHGDFSAISSSCSAQTLEIIIDMYDLTQAITCHGHSTAPASTHYYQQISDRLRHSPPVQGPDWVHESIRLSALIYTHAILHRITFASSANTPHRDSIMGDTTLLCALVCAIEHTDVIGCWGDMRGVFLWVCLTGGAASWGMENTQTGAVSAQMAWPRKCLSLWAIRAVVGVGFESANDIMESLRTGLEVGNLLEGKDS